VQRGGVRDERELLSQARPLGMEQGMRDMPASFSDIMMVLDDLRTMHHKQTQWLRQMEQMSGRRDLEESWQWALRSGLSVGLSSLLVLDGHFQSRTHGYGILALITCINCSEKLQGDLLRKSMERFLGTSIGSFAAMLVLYLDDYVVPERMGWYAREDFYVAMITSITMGGVMLRSQNQMKPLYDYSYYLSIISFDFLILNSYKHVHQFQEGLFSIMMAMLGGVFTCVVGILVFPQYAGAELTRLTANSLEIAAAELESAGLRILDRVTPQQKDSNVLASVRCLSEVKRMQELATLSVFELRFFSPVHGGLQKLLPQVFARRDWQSCLKIAEAAALICEVCSAVRSICEAQYASTEERMGSSHTQRLQQCELEAVRVLKAAAEIVILCARIMRAEDDKVKQYIDESIDDDVGGQYQVTTFQEDVNAEYAAFQYSVASLEAALSELEDTNAAMDGSMRHAAIRTLVVQLPPTVYACISSLSGFIST